MGNGRGGEGVVAEVGEGGSSHTASVRKKWPQLQLYWLIVACPSLLLPPHLCPARCTPLPSLPGTRAALGACLGICPTGRTGPFGVLNFQALWGKLCKVQRYTNT